MVQYHIPVHACSVSLHYRGIWQQAYSWDLLYTTGKILLIPYISARHKTHVRKERRLQGSTDTELVCDIEPQGVMKLHSMWAIMSLRAYKIDSNV